MVNFAYELVFSYVNESRKRPRLPKYVDVYGKDSHKLGLQIFRQRYRSSELVDSAADAALRANEDE